MESVYFADIQLSIQINMEVNPFELMNFAIQDRDNSASFHFFSILMV